LTFNPITATAAEPGGGGTKRARSGIQRACGTLGYFRFGAEIASDKTRLL
jgi:hypothetical protein